MQEEIWKDVPDYEGFYQVSNLGRVRSLERKVLDTTGKFQFFKQKVLKHENEPSGYCRVRLSKRGKVKNIRVHQLVAMAFLGHKPNGHKLVVDHINNNKFDNRVENLQLISVRENSSKDQKRHNRSSKYVGVSWDKTHKKWVARIDIFGVKKYISSFHDEYEAHLAYQRKLQEVLEQKK